MSPKKAPLKSDSAKKISADQQKKEKQKEEEKILPQQKLRIRLTAYDHRVLDTTAKQIIEIAIREGCTTIGPIPLPTEIKKYTVLRSPFIHKDAREQFEMRIYKRLIDIPNPTPKLIEALSSLNVPTGVDIEIKSP